MELPDKNKLLKNFSCCTSWEEKYMYIIELGNYLTPLPDNMRTSQHLITGCQSQVWIVMLIDINGNIQFYGDSDAAIVKGLIAVVFVFYMGLTPLEILNQDIEYFLSTLSLTEHLTFSRSHGLGTIIRAVRCRATALLS